YGGASLYLNTFGNIGKSVKSNAIYDSSHCLGANIEEIGLAHVLSLAPTKLVTSCEGGLILTNNKPLFDFAKEYRDKCSRMSEIHALIGLRTLEYINQVLEWKERVWHYYKSYIPGKFQEIPNNSNYNTIGFLNTEELHIPKNIKYKQYYEPIWDNGVMEKTNTKKIYDQMVCLPSYHGCPYVRIVDDILEMNGL
ncbi:MAG: DegT/DnrJ/EryC1/StrS family aminotransferase, partial [Gammaproteobacteria bacterium]|nr:DegT/DnrJ/EryC1/StrS family aminotransferase [Gammaproteobacteria bacterium]